MSLIRKMLSVMAIVGVLPIMTAHATIVDRIVAVVNDEIITLSELNSNTEVYLSRIGKKKELGQNAKVMNQLRGMILNTLIEKKLIDQEAKKLGVVATDTEVADMMADLLKKKNISREQFEEQVVAQGSSVEAYEAEIKDHLTKMNLMGKEIKPKITISKIEIGNYYRTHRDEYEGKAAVRIKQILILVPKDADAETRQAKRNHAEDILQRLQRGESFQVLAVEYSEGSAANAGGDVGYVEKGLMMPAVEAVAFSLDIGATSGIIKSPVGFHIIRVTDKRGAGIKPIESVRSEIIGKIGDEKVEVKFNEWLKEQKEKSHIDIRL